MKHPGIILNDDYMRPAKLSANKLATSLCVPQNRISLIIKGERNITPDTAKRLAIFFGNDPIEWMIMQVKYDLSIAPTPKIRSEVNK